MKKNFFVTISTLDSSFKHLTHIKITHNKPGTAVASCKHLFPLLKVYI